MTYNDFISQFTIYDNPPEKKGYHRHHIVPVSEQITPDNRQVYLTLPQHMWAHILYDRENVTKTARWFLIVCNKPLEFFTDYMLCLSYAYTLRKKREIAGKKISEKLSGDNSYWYGKVGPMYGRTGEKCPSYGKHRTEESKKKQSESISGEKHWNYGKHLTEEHRKNLSESLKGNNKGQHWYNDGYKEIHANECPEGFTLGRLSSRNKGSIHN